MGAFMQQIIREIYDGFLRQIDIRNSGTREMRIADRSRLYQGNHEPGLFADFPTGTGPGRIDQRERPTQTTFTVGDRFPDPKRSGPGNEAVGQQNPAPRDHSKGFDLHRA